LNPSTGQRKSSNNANETDAKRVSLNTGNLRTSNANSRS